MAADIFTRAFTYGSRWRDVIDLTGTTILDGVEGVEALQGKKGWEEGQYESGQFSQEAWTATKWVVGLLRVVKRFWSAMGFG